jgi:periplasmic protein TonB
MFHSKTLSTRADQVFLPAPASPEATKTGREPRQRWAMLVALALLIVALGVVIYRDRDFWFPDTQESEDQLEPVLVSATTPEQQVAKALVERPAAKQPSARTTRTTTPGTKPHVAKTMVKPSAAVASAAKIAAGTAGSTSAPSAKVSSSAVASSTPPPSAPAAASTAVSASAPSSTPMTPSGQPANATATRTVLPPLEVEVVAGDNHSTVRPGTNSVHVDLKPGSPPKPVTDASMAGNAPATAASVTTNATERVQMSAGAAEVVSQPVQPGYPMLARQMKVQGSVILQALIGRDGTIQDLHVLSGPGILANAAQEAVRQWRFKPHYVGSEAVETQAKITVNFTISTN